MTFLTSRIRNISVGQPFAIGQRADIPLGDLDDASGNSLMVAVKVLRAVPYDDQAARQELRQSLEAHLDMWCALKHPNITDLLGLSYDVPFPAAHGRQNQGAARQVDARGGIFNDVAGDQNNIQIIVNNYSPSASIEEADEDISSLKSPDIDPELNKYPPLVKYGLDIVMKTTTLITTNTVAAADLIEIPETIKSNIQSIMIKKTSFRYSFFPEPKPQPCDSPLVPACPVCFSAFP